jgi:hypothetical protein
MRISFDRHEMRRDRRYPLPQLTLTIDGTEYAAANWSLGGFLLPAGMLQPSIGSILVGAMRFHDGRAVEFRAEVVRVEADPVLVGARFQELSDEAFTLLDRALGRKMAPPG